MKKILLSLIIIMMFPIVSALTIQTNSNLYNVVELGHNVNFTIASDDINATSHWLLNNVDLNTNVTFQSITFSNENYSYLTVYQTNGSLTSNTIRYTIIVTPSINTTSFSKFDTTLADNMTRGIENSSITEVLIVSRDYYTTLLGLTFYVLIWGIYAGMLYIRHNTWHIPAILAIILSTIILSQLSAEYRGIVQFGIAMGAFAVIYSFFKSKR